jgi:SAM-dependent methyltransferase
MSAPLHVNYRFMLHYAARSGGQILDYGCGGGEVVRAGLESGLNIWGCETFYAGAHLHRDRCRDLIGSRILEMKEGIIPFPDESFDCVVSNMVFEHIADIDLELSEIARVLKPGGTLVSLFPVREVLREGHCGVPLAHRFSHSRFGYAWLLAGRCLGMGYFTEGKTRRQWARDFQQWLNSYCFYRTKEEIFSAFERRSLPLTGLEWDYIRYRGLFGVTPWLLHKLGCMVVGSTKSPAAARTPWPRLSVDGGF